MGSGELQATLEYVQGVPLTSLFSHRLLEPYHLDLLFEMLHCMHSCEGVALSSGSEALRAHYMDKLVARFAMRDVYSWPGAERTLAAIKGRLGAYLDSSPPCVPVVHGDCWFANILLTPANAFKFVDMRGRLAEEATLNGDPNYDYAKSAQSLLGFDEAVFGLQRVQARRH